LKKDLKIELQSKIFEPFKTWPHFPQSFINTVCLKSKYSKISQYQNFWQNLTNFGSAFDKQIVVFFCKLVLCLSPKLGHVSKLANLNLQPKACHMVVMMHNRHGGSILSSNENYLLNMEAKIFLYHYTIWHVNCSTWDTFIER